MNHEEWRRRLHAHPLSEVFRAKAGPGRPLKRSGAGYVALCPFHDDKRPSFSLTDGQGYFCHSPSCGVRGKHAVSLMHRFEGGTISDAEDAVARMAGLPDRPPWRGSTSASPSRPRNPGQRGGSPSATPPVAPRALSPPDPDDPAHWPVRRPPAGAPGPDEAMWMPGRGGRPGRTRPGRWDFVHWYRDIDGSPIMAILRRDATDTEPKRMRPATWRVRPDGKGVWTMRGLPAGEPRPVYGMETIGQWERSSVELGQGDRFGTLVIVEGERTAERAREVLDMRRVLCPQGGSKVSERADWTPLFEAIGRHRARGGDPAPAEAVIWPDADPVTEAGNPRHANAARVISGLLSGHRRSSLAEIPFDELMTVRVVRLPRDAPAGWDLGDVARVTERARARARELLAESRVISGLSPGSGQDRDRKPAETPERNDLGPNAGR